MFRQELQELKSVTPSILAFGTAAYRLMRDNLSPDEYSKLIKLTHYSHQIGKERYRETVLGQIHACIGGRVLPEQTEHK